jgi:hypothetical protein
LRPVRVTLAVGLLLSALTVGCDDADRDRTAAPPRIPPAESPVVPTPQAAPASVPVRIDLRATGRPQARLRAAIEMLRRVGMWRDLTGHLLVVQIGVRPGTTRLPEDGHLADAYPTGVFERGRTGSLCSIVFYPAAMQRELRRLETAGYESSARALWPIVLAHELGHCGPDPARRGEGAAQAVEAEAARLIDNLSR